MNNNDKVIFIYNAKMETLVTLDGRWALTGVRAVKSDGVSLSQPQHLSVLNEMAKETHNIISGYEQNLELLSKIDGFKALESDLKEDIAYLQEKESGYRKEFIRLDAENKLLKSLITDALKS